MLNIKLSGIAGALSVSVCCHLSAFDFQTGTWFWWVQFRSVYVNNLFVSWDLHGTRPQHPTFMYSPLIYVPINLLCCEAAHVLRFCNCQSAFFPSLSVFLTYTHTDLIYQSLPEWGGYLPVTEGSLRCVIPIYIPLRGYACTPCIESQRFFK